MSPRQPGIRPAIFILITVQPLLDVISYWLNALSISNELTLAVRFGLLILTVLWGFLHSSHRGYYWGLGAFSVIFLALHGFACWQAGYAAPVSDMINQVRILVLPWTTLVFITMLECENGCRSVITRAFLINLAAIILIEILSTATGTDPHTYANKGLGMCGWFYFPNSQSAILSTLVSVAISFSMQKTRRWQVLGAVCMVCFGVLFLFATRLSFVALIFSGLVLGLGNILRGKEHRKAGAAILVCAAFFLALYPLSPMVKNQAMMADNYEKRQEWIDSKLESYTGSNEMERLEPIYEEYLPGLVEHFGLERTVAAYNGRTDCRIAELRPAKLTYSKMLLEDSPRSALLFGMEISRWSTSSGSYDVENDLHGVFFLCGAAGLFCLLAFFLCFMIRTLLFLVKNPKALFTPEILGWGTATVMCSAHIYATAGVLRRPNASFYLAVCLAVVWDLTRSRKDGYLRQ